MYAGSSATAELTVTPFDGTTAATLTVTNPAGTTSTVSPAPATSNGGNTWTATVAYPAAGRYVLKWTVTGTGARVDRQIVVADPLDPRDRSYATTTDLANYIGGSVPDDADRMLARATELIDRILITATYQVDADGDATDTDVIAALTKATCAQVAWWVETGDETGLAGVYQSISIGGVSLSRGGSASKGSSNGSRIAPDAWNVLSAAGLTGHAAWLI